MKKVLLIGAVLVSGVVSAQSVSDLRKSDNDKVTKDMIKAVDISAGEHIQGMPHVPYTEGTLEKSRQDVYSFVNIGTSYYDLQSNAAVGRRLLLHDDGTVSTVWTYSPDASSGWPQRGTGFNYFDGSSWGAGPSARTETSRTGWPSIAELSDGSITTFAHISSDGGFIQASKPSKSSTTWTSSTARLQYNNGVPIWNRMAVNGDTIHLLCNFWSDGGAVPETFIGGISNPTTYSRSDDGGATWAVEHMLMPGYDSTEYDNGGGDTYAIDIKGSTVAVVIGGIAKDLVLWKSTDNGQNWTKTDALPTPVPKYKWGKAVLSQDSNYVTNDGSVDVVIDNNGDCHIVTGLLGIYDDDTTDESIFIPQFFSMYHWSENSPQWKVCGSPIDMDLATDPETGANWTIASETTASLGTDGQPPSGLSYAARYGRTSISTHPSISVDANNNLFVTYDAPLELIFHDFGANPRNVNVVYSDDNGDTWSDAQNATQWRTKECVFGSQARMADDYIHFIFQADDYPGTHLQNNGNTGLHPNDEVGIYYAAIPTSDIMAGNLGANNLSAPSRDLDAKVFVVSQNYPNPFAGMTTVTIYMRSGSDLDLTVTDILGKEVMNKELGYKTAGNHQIVIDGSQLNPGIYFYTLTSGDHKVTRKMKVID